MSEESLPKMNSKYAWRELAREGLPQRSATDRVADFLEIHGLYDEETAREQASRCIQCPNPTCVSGCPLCNPIPQWMQLTAEGRFLEAAAVLGSVTNMAEICTRICPSDQLCEHSCILDSVSEPVSIQAIERFLADYAIRHGQTETATAPPNGLKVAVVGSGPGGLACADDLARAGCAVTIIDSDLVPGGLLVNGIPAFKLNRSLVERRLEILRKRGVKMRLGVKLWEDVTLGQLRSEFDAVYLGLDSRQARPLEVPGAGLRGVMQALPFLLQKSTAVPLDLPPIGVEGKRVTVIGGGDTAMDCLRTALRYGAREAVGVYRREAADMPCGRSEYEAALEEGARFVFQAAPVAVADDGRGQVRAVRLARTEVGLASGEMGSGGGAGRRVFTPVAGSEFELETDLVILALGFDPLPCPHSGDFGELAVNEWGGLVVDEKQRTSLAGVFAGGDVVRGPTPVLYTVRDGRRAAAGILEGVSS